MRPSLALLVPAILAGVLASSAQAAEGGAGATVQPGVPGGTFVQTMQMSAEVLAIDAAARILTVRSEGREAKVKVGPEAVNFPQIKVGDKIKVRVVEEMVVAMADAAAPVKDGAGAAVVLAPEGSKPAGVTVVTGRVTATVVAIDQASRLATLSFPDGSKRAVKVRPDVDLKLRKVGEQVIITITEAMAISVEAQ